MPPVLKMIIIISPSKTLNFSDITEGEYTNPDFLENSQILIDKLKKLSVKKICTLMDISEKLSELNWQRYHDFATPFAPHNAKQALYAFQGDVYDGLQAETLTRSDIKYASAHLRIISGLYGLLKPLDLIQPYRLEMGTKLANKNGKDLYQFWGNKITDKLNEMLKADKAPVVINLASVEYFKAVNTKILNARIITPVFKEKKADGYKIVALFAKRARGMMAGYIIKNHLKNIEDIKNFQEGGYKFNPILSTDYEWVFTR